MMYGCLAGRAERGEYVAGESRKSAGRNGIDRQYSIDSIEVRGIGILMDGGANIQTKEEKREQRDEQRQDQKEIQQGLEICQVARWGRVTSSRGGGRVCTVWLVSITMHARSTWTIRCNMSMSIYEDVLANTVYSANTLLVVIARRELLPRLFCFL